MKKTNRELDNKVLGINESKNKVYEAWGSLRYLGITNEYKGIFEGKTVEFAITEMSKCKEHSCFTFMLSPDLPCILIIKIFLKRRILFSTETILIVKRNIL